MNFDNVKTSLVGTLSCLHEGIYNSANFLWGQRMGNEPPLTNWIRSHTDYVPGALAPRLIRVIHGTISFPWPLHTSLTPGMCELNAGHRPLTSDKSGNPHERLDLTILPQAHITVGNPPPRLHSGGLHKHNSCAAHSKVREMCKMPVCGVSIPGRILAHRRHDNSVPTLNVTQGNRRKESRTSFGVPRFDHWHPTSVFIGYCPPQVTRRIHIIGYNGIR